MADVLASVSVVLGAEIAGFKAAMANAKKELRGLVQAGEAMKDMGQSLLPLSAALGAAGLGSVKLAGDLEKANVNFEVMLGSAAKATAVLTDLKDFAASTPFEFPEVQDAAKKLLAFNTPAEELKDTLRQLGDVSAGIDAPIGEIAELFGKARVQGRLFQEDINQLTGRGIPIIQELAKQFNISDSEVRKLVETGKVGFPNLQQAFADLTSEGGKFSGLMAKQSETIPGLVSTVMDAVKGFAADFGTEIIKAFDLKGALKSFIAFAENLRAQFAALEPSTKKLIIGLGALAVAVGPLLYGIGTLLTLLPTLAAGFTVLTGPVGLVVAALAVAATAIIANWDDIVAYFTTGDGGRVFKNLAESVKAAVATIQDAWDRLDFSGDTFGDLIGIVDILKAAFTSLASGISGIADTVNGMVRLVVGALNGDWTKAWDAAKQIVLGIYGPLANLLGLDYGKFKDFLGVQGDGGKSGVSQYFKGLTQNVGGFLAVAPFATAAVEDFKDAADKPTPPLINEEQVKALADLQEALRLNERNSLALGDAYEFISSKASALKSGILDLVKAGFAPASAVVQRYVAQLRALPEAYDQVVMRLSKGIAAPKIEKPEDLRAFDVDLGKLPTLQFDGSFAVKAQEAAALYTAALASMTPAQLAATDQLAAFNTRAGEAVEGMNQVISSGLADAAASMAAGIANVLSGAAPISDLGGILLGAVGDILIQLGKLAITTGIVVEAIKKAFTNPFTAIAAGAAAIALGTFVKGAATKILSGGGGGGGGGAAAFTPPAPRAAAPAPARSAPIAPQGQAVLEKTIRMVLDISPSQFRAMGTFSTDRFGRVVGG